AASQEVDSTFIMDADNAIDTSIDGSAVLDDVVDVAVDADINLDDLDMDFELPDLDAADEILGVNDSSMGDHDLDISMESDSDIELLAFDEGSIDSLDSGMDDLDISTTAIDPASFGMDDSAETVEVDKDLFADLDADLSDLEVHESIISNVSDLNVSENIELDGKDVLLDESEDLDKTFILNDIAKNKAMLEEVSAQEPTHFSDLDAALEGASSVDDDPMIDAFSVTEELENINVKDPGPLDTIGASSELDELMKDLDGLLDEDKNKK
ncbi:MAG: hypothetical protein Q9M44_07625, partial [Ghiorsea sp.]|nr:hypothetical protein [Ghiorsea sp.]